MRGYAASLEYGCTQSTNEPATPKQWIWLNVNLLCRIQSQDDLRLFIPISHYNTEYTYNVVQVTAEGVLFPTGPIMIDFRSIPRARRDTIQLVEAPLTSALVYEFLIPDALLMRLRWAHALRYRYEFIVEWLVG